jgi:predicted nucleic acid-binding protein
VDVAEHISACRDPKDDKFLELAISGHANYIVSGDSDLLALNPFRGVLITPPHTFLKLI